MKKWTALWAAWMGLIVTPIVLVSKSFVLPAISFSVPVIVLLYLFPVIIFFVAKFTKKEKTFSCFLLLCNVICLVYISLSVFLVDYDMKWLYPLGSKTTSTENYLTIDKEDLYAVEEDKLFSVFPEEIPDNASDVRYEYSYYTDMYILAQWVLPKEDFNTEKRRVAEMFTYGATPEIDQEKYLFENTGANKFYVEFDEQTYSVKYEFYQVEFSNQ